MEGLSLAPLVALIVFLGVYPKPVLERIELSVVALVSHVSGPLGFTEAEGPPRLEGSTEELVVVAEAAEEAAAEEAGEGEGGEPGAEEPGTEGGADEGWAGENQEEGE